MKIKFHILKFLFNLILLNIFLLNNVNTQEIHDDLLKRLDVTFPAEIFFTQTDSNKTSARGWMVIGQKGFARVEFEPPNHFIMVADGSWLIFHDAQYDRTSYFPLDKGILGALLHPEKFNSENKLSISRLKNNTNLYYSVLSENFEGSELKVYFDKSSEELKGWEIFENGELSIKVDISKINELDNLISFNKNIFKFPEFMRASSKGFLGPYKRIIKKLPTSNRN